jgi:SAM-dependent methyltransferase
MGDQWPVEELFDEDYLRFFGPRLDETADAGAALVWDLAGLAGGSDVLDLACGHGRIANRLATRGARVTGLDAVPLFLDRARADAAARGVAVDYVHGDMRDLPWTGRFDAVVSWYTAYGYFDDDQNRAVLDGVHRALRPGGRFVVELNHRDACCRTGSRPSWSRTRAGCSSTSGPSTRSPACRTAGGRSCATARCATPTSPSACSASPSCVTGCSPRGSGAWTATRVTAER